MTSGKLKALSQLESGYAVAGCFKFLGTFILILAWYYYQIDVISLCIIRRFQQNFRNIKL